MGRTYELTPARIAKQRRIDALARIGRACRGDHGGPIGCDRRATYQITTTEPGGRVLAPSPVCATYARIVTRSIAYHGSRNPAGQVLGLRVWP